MCVCADSAVYPAMLYMKWMRDVLSIAAVSVWCGSLCMLRGIAVCVWYGSLCMLYGMAVYAVRYGSLFMLHGMVVDVTVYVCCAVWQSVKAVWYGGLCME